MNIKDICKLIDKSNQGDKEAETQLIKLGVYNEDGELITTNTTIIKYYKKNWC
jgi:hypothetical protein